MKKTIELPEEVWLNILRYHTSPIHLWVDCRRVSHRLRRCAQSAYEDKFLGKLRITLLYRWPSSFTSQRMPVDLPAYDLTFNRLQRDEDGHLTNEAVFSGTRQGPGFVAQYHYGLLERLDRIRVHPRHLNRVSFQLRVTARTSRICDIFNNIQRCRDMLNDDDGTMSFEWPTMISELYSKILRQEQNVERATASTRDIVRKKPRKRPPPRKYRSELLREGRLPKWKQIGPPRRSARIVNLAAKASQC